MPNVAKPNFTGVLTPKIDVRIDTEAYASGCRRLDNMIPTVFGLVTRRPGTEMIFIHTGYPVHQWWLDTFAKDYEHPASDPAKIHISTAEELQLVGSTGFGGAYPRDGDYELLNDIDLIGVDWIPINHLFLNPFVGTFDGRYFTISNMTITYDVFAAYQGVGLFSHLDDTGGAPELSRIVLTNASITISTGGTETTGLLCGLDLSSGTALVDCYAQGTITQTAGTMVNVGGIIGQSGARSTYLRCGTDVTIVSSSFMRFTGGFTGDGNDGTIYTDCYAVATITSASNDIDFVGGFNGRTFWRSAIEPDNAVYTNCYSASTISGTRVDSQSAGGFIGQYHTTSDQDEEYSSCYWDGDVQGLLNLEDCGRLATTGSPGSLDGVNKKTTLRMKSESTYIGWDFDDIWIMPFE